MLVSFWLCLFVIKLYSHNDIFKISRKSRKSVIKETGLTEANPQYVHIRHFNRIEKTVPIRHFAPMSHEDYIDEINTVKKAISELTIAEYNMIYITVLGNNLALLLITCKAKR